MRAFAIACFLFAVALLRAPADAQSTPDASMLAPIRAWIDAYNSGRALPEDIFTPDVIVTDEFAPYVWRGSSEERQWARVIDAFIKPGQQHVSVGAAQSFSSDGDRVSFVLPATLTIAVAPHPPRTERADWTFELVRTNGRWLIASDLWTGDAASKAPVSVPLRSVRGIQLVQATLDGTGPFWFMLDPGGSDAYSSYALPALNGKSPKTLCIAGRCVPTTFMRADDFSAGTDVGGSIGLAMFRQFVVRIDYGNGMVTLIPPHAYRPPSGVTALPLTFDQYQMPVIPASVDGVAGLFQLDIRARSSLLFRAFLARNGWGLQRQVTALTIAGATVNDPPFKVSPMTSGKFADPVEAGLLGNSVLSRFIVTVDVPQQRVFLQPAQEVHQ